MPYNENCFKLADINNTLNEVRVTQIEPLLDQLVDKQDALSPQGRELLERTAKEYTGIIMLSHLAYATRQSANAIAGFELKWRTVSQLYKDLYTDFLPETEVTKEQLADQIEFMQTTKFGKLLDSRINSEGQTEYRMFEMQP